MKISNIIKFIVTLVIIFGITGFLVFQFYRNANYIGNLVNEVTDSEYSGKYIESLSKILANNNISEETRTDVVKLIKNVQVFEEAKRVRYNNVIICLMAISSVSLITIGILIFKLTKEKAVGLGIITGSILTTLIYVFIFSAMLYNAILF